MIVQSDDGSDRLGCQDLGLPSNKLWPKGSGFAGAFLRIRLNFPLCPLVDLVKFLGCREKVRRHRPDERPLGMVAGEEPAVPTGRAWWVSIPQAEQRPVALRQLEQIDRIARLTSTAYDPCFAPFWMMSDHPTDVLAPCLDDRPVGAFTVRCHAPPPPTAFAREPSRSAGSSRVRHPRTPG